MAAHALHGTNRRRVGALRGAAIGRVLDSRAGIQPPVVILPATARRGVHLGATSWPSTGRTARREPAGDVVPVHPARRGPLQDTTHPEGLLATFPACRGSEGLSTPFFLSWRCWCDHSCARLRVGPGGLALVAGPLAPLHRLFANGWCIDQYYAALIVTPGKANPPGVHRLRRFHRQHRERGGRGVPGALARRPDGLRPRRTQPRSSDRRVREVPPVNRLLTIVRCLPPGGASGDHGGRRGGPRRTAVQDPRGSRHLRASLVVLAASFEGDAGFQMVEHAMMGQGRRAAVPRGHRQRHQHLDGAAHHLPCSRCLAWKIDKGRAAVHGRDAGAGDRYWLVGLARPSCCSSCSSKQSWCRCTGWLGRGRLRRGEVLPAHTIGGLGVPAASQIPSSCTPARAQVWAERTPSTCASPVRWQYPAGGARPMSFLGFFIAFAAKVRSSAAHLAAGRAHRSAPPGACAACC